MRELKVFVGPGFERNETELKMRLNIRSGVLLNNVAHALLDHSDDGAQIHSVKVQHITIDSDFPSQVEIAFEISWSLYKGCEDKNLSDDEVMQESATYTSDGYLVFTVPSLRRPANPC